MSNQKILRLARLPRLYRLVRLLRMFKMMRLLKNNETLNRLFEIINIHPAAMRLLKILIILFLYPVHIMACLWFYVASFYGDPNSWANGIGLFEE